MISLSRGTSTAYARIDTLIEGAAGTGAITTIDGQRTAFLQWESGLGLGPAKQVRMSTDLRIPVTSEQEKLILEAASQEPEGMTTWARTILLQAARDQIARRDNPPEVTADQAFLEEFQALADQWRRETDMHSSITKKTQHPAYRKIIDMGENALPWILRELRDRPGYWFETLRIISKQTPVSEAERSDPKKVREAWLKWGQKKGFLG